MWVEIKTGFGQSRKRPRKREKMIAVNRGTQPKREALCSRGKDSCRNCFREVATFERHQGGKDEKRAWWGNREKEKAQKINFMCSDDCRRDP